MIEQWRRIPGYPDYEVSDQGRVRSYRGHRWSRSQEPRLLAIDIEPRHGYPRVRIIRENGAGRTTYVHQLVLLAFVGPAPESEERIVTRHIDGNPANSRLENLTYGTQSENIRDTVRHGRHPWANKTHCKAGHAFDAKNTYISPTGARRCRICRGIYKAAWKRRRAAATGTQENAA